MNPIVLVVGGSDSSGGSGIQADLRSIQACGGIGLTLVTAVTAQSSQRLLVEPVRQGMLDAQAQSWKGISFHAVKTGLLPTVEAVHAARDLLALSRTRPRVVDPVTHASSGFRLMAEAAYAHFVDEVLPLTDLITPNADEALRLSGMEARQAGDRSQVANRILDYGCGAVLLKGGHYTPNRSDLLVTREGQIEFDRPTHLASVRGTGCFLASAIATELAMGKSLDHAVRGAHRVLDRAWSRHVELGQELRLLNGTSCDGATT